jgi:AcrR family transcriptional regulator
MKDARREEKKRAIREAAYALLAEKGYKATSMLEIAKRASASNETLYRWYGNKQGLFREMVEENARDARELVERSLKEGASPFETLRLLGPAILKIVTGPRAIALNRAAAADVHETGLLGPTIAASGRNTLAPMIARMLGDAQAGGKAVCEDPEAATEFYLALLIGDIQIRCVSGAIDAPGEAAIEARAEWALRLLQKHLGGEAGAPG